MGSMSSAVILIFHCLCYFMLCNIIVLHAKSLFGSQESLKIRTEIELYRTLTYLRVYHKACTYIAFF